MIEMERRYSIVIPLYNKEREIKRTLDSVVSQSYRNWECLVIDDGSTDSGAQIVKRYDDVRIKYYYKDNGGPASARNFGVQKALSDWVIFLDADDMFVPNALEVFDSCIEKNNGIKCFVCNMFTQRGDKLIKYSFAYKDGIIRNNYASLVFNQCRMRVGTSMFSKEVLIKHPFNEQLRRYEDTDVTFRIMSEYKVYECTTPVYIYNLNAITASKRRRSIKEDYLGHLKMVDGSLFQKVMIYDMYLRAKRNYPEEARILYSEYEKMHMLRFCTSFLRNGYLQKIYKHCVFFKYLL